MSNPLRGLVVNFRHAMPSRAEILYLQPEVIRSIVYSDQDLDVALTIIPPHIKVIALLSTEHEDIRDGYPNWHGYVQRFASKYTGRVWAVEIENEADIKGIPPQTIASLLYHCQPLNDAGIIRIASSVAGSNWQAYLDELNKYVTRQHVDGCALHAYGQTVWSLGPPQPGFLPGLSPSIARASDLMGGLPCYVTEFGAKISDYGGEARQASYVSESFKTISYIKPEVCPVACYFAWHDGVGGPDERGDNGFGLIRMDNSRRPSHAAYAALGGGAVIDPPVIIPQPTYVYVLGFKEIHDANPVIIGDPLENEGSPHGGLSFQRTTNGLLWWADTTTGDGKGFIANDGTRYLWSPSKNMLGVA